MTTKWVVDINQVVHAAYCVTAKEGVTTPYVPSRIVRDAAGKPTLDKVHDYQEMSVHLAGPDVSGGMMARHQGPTILKPCSLCIPSEEIAS